MTISKVTVELDAITLKTVQDALTHMAANIQLAQNSVNLQVQTQLKAAAETTSE